MRVIPVAVMALVMVMGVGSSPLAYADQATYSVGIPAGTSVPGCEVDNRCYIPADVTVNVGGEVTWSNDDSAAHTVTSGALSDSDYGSMFDSGLFLSGATFSVTFDEQGEFPYFCVVHPWMEGSVIVDMDAPRPESEPKQEKPIPEPEPEPVPETAPEVIPEPEPAAADSGLEERVEDLEGRVGILESILDSLRSFFGF